MKSLLPMSDELIASCGPLIRDMGVEQGRWEDGSLDQFKGRNFVKGREKTALKGPTQGPGGGSR